MTRARGAPPAPGAVGYERLAERAPGPRAMASGDADLTANSKFMDLYSRQIGAYGMETMAKLVNMKVLLVGLKGVGVETAKNLILAGPGQVTLVDSEPAELKDLGANFFLTEADVGRPRAEAVAPRLQELNALVKVRVHGGELTEELVGAHDMMVMTTGTRDELIRWNEFCRSHETVQPDPRGKRVTQVSPVKFLAARASGAFSWVFSDFGDSFLVSDETGEPTVTRTITGITCEEEGIVQLVDPHTSELARPHGVEDTDHRGYVTFSEVEGMYCKDESSMRRLGHSINSSGPWRVSHVWKTVPESLIVPRSLGGDGKQREEQYWVYARGADGAFLEDKDQPDGRRRVPKFARECSGLDEADFVREADGSKSVRMTKVKDFYKLRIGDTRGYSPYEGGGVLTQVLEPVEHRHRSLASCLQNPGDLLSCDGDKEEKGYWYPMLHVLKQALFAFEAEAGRPPAPNSAEDADRVVALAKSYNAAMRSLRGFCGDGAACAIPLDLDGATAAPPDAGGLPEERRAALKAVEDMGLDRVRAFVALEANNWDAESAAMWPFVDADANARMDAQRSAVDAFEALRAMRTLALVAACELQPLCCFVGGVVAQEIVKNCGKFTPLKQFLHLDCFEVLPRERPSDCAPSGDRYEHNVALFGAAVQRRLRRSSTFMVGCGALGCEFLKNFALLGVATDEEGVGEITVTDGDRIEVSNLNRQFLFRAEHVGTAKSTTAAVAAKAMNAAMRVRSLELLAMPSTEKTFDDAFWRRLDFVTNALDSVTARKYVDARCVFFRKPLLESGTEGTKFNSMVVLPGETESYDEGDPEPPAGENVPMCTLRSFPSTAVHCIEWARGFFEDAFVSPVAALRDFLEDPSALTDALKESAQAYMLDANDLSKRVDELRGARDGAGLIAVARRAAEAKRGGFGACVRMAADVFVDNFRNRILELVHQFPREHTTASGKPFWAPPKRFPAAAALDLEDPTTMQFVVSTANLFAVAFGLRPLPENGRDADGNAFDTFVPADHAWRSEAHVRALLEGYEGPAWQPSGVRIETEEEEGKREGAPEESLDALVKTLCELCDELKAVDVAGVAPQPADFEKDLDENFHIDFVAAAGNLRARNYRIKEVSRHRTKMTAGKIIPAIATSTACATALMCVEMLKLVQQKPKEDFRNSSNSFSINSFQMSEPLAARTIAGAHEEETMPDPISEPEAFDESGNVRPECVQRSRWIAYPDPHTKWDRIDFPKGTTLEQLLHGMREQHGVVVASWTVNVTDEDGKATGLQLYAKPSEVVGFNADLLRRIAPLDLPFNKAQMAILRCSEIRNKQLYTMQWKALNPAALERAAAFRARTLAAILEEKGADLEGRSAIELGLNLETESGDEVRTPPVVLEL